MSLGVSCRVWELVVESGSWLSSLGVGCRVWELVVESGSWLLSFGVGLCLEVGQSLGICH